MPKKKKPTWGGARKGAGRPFVAEGQEKKQVYLYVLESEIDRLGGVKAVRELCYEAIKRKKA